MPRRNPIINEEIPPSLALVDLFVELSENEFVNVSEYVKQHDITRQTFYNRMNQLSLKYPVYCVKRGVYALMKPINPRPNRMLTEVLDGR